MLELTILLGLIIFILIILRYKSKYSNTGYESFSNLYHLDACPKGFKSFYNDNGDVVCCNGEIVANRCLSDEVCMLSGEKNGIPNCSAMMINMYKAKSDEYCPKSMPQYFELGNNKGCTSGNLNSSMNGPSHPDQPLCIIYTDFNDNFNNKDSCSNQRMLDEAECFGNNCTKSIQDPVPGKPLLVAIGFTDSNGMHRIAYTRESMENFLNATNPNWKSKIDLTKNINVAEVAKAFYIDRTLQQSDIQF
jgi:hypothetical protein